MFVGNSKYSAKSTVYSLGQFVFFRIVCTLWEYICSFLEAVSGLVTVSSTEYFFKSTVCSLGAVTILSCICSVSVLWEQSVLLGVQFALLGSLYSLA